MAEERDIRARLEVQTEGSFAEPREDLEQLVPTATQVEERFRALLAQAEELGRTAGPDELREKSVALGRELTDLLETVQQQLGANTTEAQALGAQIDQLRQRIERAADPLTAALDAADQEAAHLLETLRGGGDAAQGLVRLRLATERVRDELEKAEAAGRRLGDAPRASLDRLTRTYDEGVQAAGRYRAAQRQVGTEVDRATEAASRQYQTITGLDDLLASVNPKVADFAFRWGNALSAVAVARGGLRQLESQLNSLGEQLTGQKDLFRGLSDFIPGTTRALESGSEAVANYDRAWAAFLGGDFKQADQYIGGLGDRVAETTSLMALWRANGLDPTGKSLDELRAKLPELNARFQDTRQGLADLLHPNQQLRDELAQSADELVRFVEILQRHGRLDEGTRAWDTARRRAAALTEEMRQAGLDIPEGLAAVNAALDTNGLAWEQWAEGLGLSREALAETADALAENIARFAEANDQLAPDDLAALFGDQVQQILDQADRLQTDVPPKLASLADAWGIVSSAAEAAADQQQRVASRLRQQITGEAAKVREELVAELEALPAALEGVDFSHLRFLDPEQFEADRLLIQSYVDEFRRLGVAVPAEVQRAATELGILLKQSDLTGEELQKLAGAFDDASAGSVRFTRDADGAVTGLESLFQGFTDGADEAGRFATEQNAAAAGSEDAGRRFARAADDVAAGTTALGEQAAAAGEAAGEIGGAAQATEGLADAQGSAAAGLRTTADETDRLGRSIALIPSHATAAGSALADSMRQAGSEVDGLATKVDGLLTRLDRAAQLAAQLQGATPTTNPGAA